MTYIISVLISIKLENINVGTIKAINNAIPPDLTIGLLCIFLLPGKSYKFKFFPIFRHLGTKKVEIKTEIIKGYKNI
tara:strand:+ start:701 stop:931 length:231 start_codon:yes stop_codon:yes gene_type:complete